MTFIIILISLIIERFFDWSHLRRWRWILQYQAWMEAKLKRLPASLILIVGLLPLMLGVAMINWLLSGWPLGFLKILFGMAVLVYSLGPVNFWAEMYKSLKDTQTVSSTIFVEANRRIFAVVFWFALLGPVGALLYRLVDLSLSTLAVNAVAKKAQAALDWLPVRLLAFVFALAGHFTPTIKQLKQGLKRGLEESNQLLTECGMAALDVNDLASSQDNLLEKPALSLIDRAFVIALVILALVVLCR